MKIRAMERKDILLRLRPAMTLFNLWRAAIVAGASLHIAAALPAQQIPTVASSVASSTRRPGREFPMPAFRSSARRKVCSPASTAASRSPSVDAGTITIQVRRVGYHAEDSHRSDSQRRSDARAKRSLAVAAARVEAQVVTATAERGTVNEALDQQRTAVGVVNAVTAEQISRSPDATPRRRCSASAA